MGRRRRRQQQPEIRPVDVDGVRAVTVGTVLWAIAFVVLLSFRADLQAADREWWLWTSLAGAGLGLLGIEYCRRRRDRLADAAELAEDDDEFSAPSPVREPPPVDESPVTPEPQGRRRTERRGGGSSEASTRPGGRRRARSR